MITVPLKRMSFSMTIGHRFTVSGQVKSYKMDTRKKIISSENLTKFSPSPETQECNVAFVRGCFDILLVEHCRLFEHAKKNRDILVVVVYSDTKTRQTILNQAARAQMVAAVDVVDYVLICDEAGLDPAVFPWWPTEIVDADPPSSRDIVGNVLQRYTAS